MSTCAKRSVLQAGDRPAQVRRAALQVQQVAKAMTQRVLPHAGGFGSPLGSMPAIRPFPRRQLGVNMLGQTGSAGGYTPGARQGMTGSAGGYYPTPESAIQDLARAVGELGSASADAFSQPRGGIATPSGRNTQRGNGTGPQGGSSGGSTSTGAGPGVAVRGGIWLMDFSAPYTEPMMVPLPPNMTPLGMIALRIISPNEITRYFRSGVACDFMPYGARAMIRSIDGMTIGDPTVLNYVFAFYGVDNA